jgi:hypothetical protein
MMADIIAIFCFMAGLADKDLDRWYISEIVYYNN